MQHVGMAMLCSGVAVAHVAPPAMGCLTGDQRRDAVLCRQPTAWLPTRPRSANNPMECNASLTSHRCVPLCSAQDLRSKVFAALEATPDGGPQFGAAVRHLLRWEDSWAAWKQAGCPPAALERPPAAPPAGAADADLGERRRRLVCPACLPASLPLPGPAF